MAEVCRRCGKPTYAAENPVRIGGMTFHPGCFTCAATGTKLTLKTARIAEDPETKEKNVYVDGKEPVLKPHQVLDINAERVSKVPDSNMNTSNRKFNIAGKAAGRGATDADLGSNYGSGAVAVETATKAPKPPTTVNNVNQTEKMHNGTDGYTAAKE